MGGCEVGKMRRWDNEKTGRWEVGNSPTSHPPLFLNANSIV